MGFIRAIYHNRDYCHFTRFVNEDTETEMQVTCLASPSQLAVEPGNKSGCLTPGPTAVNHCAYCSTPTLALFTALITLENMLFPTEAFLRTDPIVFIKCQHLHPLCGTVCCVLEALSPFYSAGPVLFCFSSALPLPGPVHPSPNTFTSPSWHLPFQTHPLSQFSLTPLQMTHI